MTHPTSIRAAVSPATIGKATRFFSGTIVDIINETFQNARRAGATLIQVELDESRKPAILSIRDNGRGIADPIDFVTLGQSSWEAGTYDEDPAGMGAFSLSSSTSTITSRTQSTDGWRATITPDAWQAKADIAVENAPEADIGTTIELEMTIEWTLRVDHAVRNAARYCPVHVVLNGQACPQSDWFASAIYRKAMSGYEIGIVESRDETTPNINFHGLTLRAQLPSVSEINGKTYRAIIDMHHAGGLELVLPARKEVIQNDAFRQLCKEAKLAIYEAIARQPEHFLSFNDWNTATALGVEMQHAKASLNLWSPPTAQCNSDDIGGLVTIGSEHTIVPQLEPAIGIPFNHAMHDHPMRASFVAEERAFEGYPWYDAISRIDNIEFEIVADGIHTLRTESSPSSNLDASIKADRITLHFDRVTNGEATTHAVPSPIAFLTETYDTSNADEVVVAWSTADKIEANIFAALLEDAYFDPSHDCDADSFETQLESFRRDAMSHAVRLLEGDDAATCNQLRQILLSQLWMLPQDRAITITIHNREIAVGISPPEPKT